MAQLHQSLICALDDEKNNYTNEKMLKLINKTEVYWFFQEVEKVLTGESNIQRYYVKLLVQYSTTRWQLPTI